MYKILLSIFVFIPLTFANAQTPTPQSKKANDECTTLVKKKWERNGKSELGETVKREFVQIFSTGPYNGQGKYGENNFMVFNLALRDQNADTTQFKVDCVFDGKGKVLGLKLRNDD